MSAAAYAWIAGRCARTELAMRFNSHRDALEQCRNSMRKNLGSGDRTLAIALLKMSLCKNFALHEKMKNRELQKKHSLQKKLRSDLKLAPPN